MAVHELFVNAIAASAGAYVATDVAAVAVN